MFLQLGLMLAFLHNNRYSSSPVISCHEAVAGLVETGPHYRGSFDDDDYKLHAKIPNGFTAWSGVADTAPFHGFIIFLNQQKTACLLLEVHIRLEEWPVPQQPEKARRFRLGQAHAWQTQTITKQLINVATFFTSKLSDQVDDGSVLLIAPEQEAAKMMAIYARFLSFFRVGS